MVFPVGGDFTRDVNNAFKVLKSDRRICAHDNGTDVCDLGHKLKFPGVCLNQAIGTFNSTDDTFQPTFPICTSNFESSGFNSGSIESSSLLGEEFLAQSIDNVVSGDYVAIGFSQVIQGIFNSISALNQVGDTYNLASVLAAVASSTFEASVASTINSFWIYAQLNSGDLPRLEGMFSDLYYLDVFTATLFYNRLAIHVLEEVQSVRAQEQSFGTLFHLISTDYYTTISGSVDICEGDEEPPSITYVDPPASGTRLRDANQVVEFKLSDPLSGVLLSSVSAYLDSTTTGNIQLLTAGVDQTGGLVSITGDSSSYRFRYVPDFTWQTNDIVTVTISGSDQAPLVDGNPFFCGPPEFNFFGGDLWFTVAEEDDLNASLTAIGDIAPPYFYNLTPASGTSNNSVFDPVIIEIADDLTGIELNSVTVSVEGTSIVTDGVPTSEEIVIEGSPSKYTITYNKDSAFSYGSSVPVSVYVEDKVTPTPNILSTSYNIDYIEDSTVIIENFLPAVGTSINLDKVDISVDMRDDSHDINSSQSFLVVNNTIVSGTVTTLASGINITYHPPNDFAFDEPIVVKVHAVNGNASAPAVKEAVYNLFYGCRIEYYGSENFDYEQQIEVLVRARNNESLFKDLTTGYFFTSYTQPSSDFGASIEAINPISDLGATLTAQGPQHRYGEEVTISFYVKDLEGRELGPYIYTYTIEENPN
jgi:hypothetical protein